MSKELIEKCNVLAQRVEKLEADRDALAAELKSLRELEPVAIYKGHRHNPSDTKEFWGMADGRLPANTPLYAHPAPARDLTDEAIENLHMQVYKGPSIAPARMLSFARAIERHLKGEGE